MSNGAVFLTRLVAAMILARQNKVLLAEVAYLRAGIGNEFHFSRLFRRRYDLSPARFRREFRRQAP